MIERRSTQGFINESNGKLHGLASPTYNGDAGTEYQLMEGIVERFAAGAFDTHLKTNPDVVALFNHDANHVLGRTPNTLQLTSDARGLSYSIDLPNTQAANDLKVSIARGDIKGSSFAFLPTDVVWERDGENDVRLIRAATLYDVSPVTTPAYNGSSVGLRSGETLSRFHAAQIMEERDEYHAKLQTEKWLARIHTINASKQA